VWIAYLIAGKTPLAWAAFIILLPVALLGFTMFARWWSRPSAMPVLSSWPTSCSPLPPWWWYCSPPGKA
jgi:hypothetical protein